MAGTGVALPYLFLGSAARRLYPMKGTSISVKGGDDLNNSQYAIPRLAIK